MKLRKYEIQKYKVYSLSTKTRDGNEIVCNYMPQKHDTRWHIAQNLRQRRLELRKLTQ